MFYKDYEDVYYKMIWATVRTLAGSSLSIDTFRFNRTFVEEQMHNTLRKKLGGQQIKFASFGRRDLRSNIDHFEEKIYRFNKKRRRKLFHIKRKLHET